MSSSQIRPDASDEFYRHLADQIAQAREPTDLQAIYELAIQQYREAHVEKKISDAQMRRIESRCAAEEILRDVEELKAKRLRSKRRFLVGVSPKTATGLLSRVGTATESLMNANPIIAGSVWSGVRVIFMAISEVTEAFKCAVEMMEKISLCVERFAEVLKILGDGESLFRNRLVAFYQAVIDFSLKVESIHKQNIMMTIVAATFSPFKGPFDELFKKLNLYAEEVDKAADVAKFRAIDSLKRAPARPTALPDSERDPLKHFTVPNLLSNHFTGQDHILAQLNTSLKEASDSSGPRRAAIWGIPGVGKTQLSYRYAEDAKNHYQNVFFLRASSREDLSKEYRRIAQLLQLLDFENDANDERLVMQIVTGWLSHTSTWLLIFDDVTEAGLVRDFVPAHGEGDILFSMRDQQTARFLAGDSHTFEVLPLDKASAVRLATTLTDSADRNAYLEDTASKLADVVGGLPIAIEQAVALSRSRNQLLAQTVNQLRTNLREVLEEEYTTSLREDRRPTAILLRMTVDSLAHKSPQAAALFRILVHLDTSCIPIELLRLGSARISTYLQRDIPFPAGRAERHPLQKLTFAQASPQSDAAGRLGRVWTGWKEDIKSVIHRDGQSHLAESASDKALRDYLATDLHLRNLLQDGHRIDDAILSLEDVGLVRRDLRNCTVWIHDLVRDINLEAMAKDSLRTQQVHALCAMTIVFLAFPTPNYIPRKVYYQCRDYLNHALSTLYHCRRFASNTTVGPELMHITASTLLLLDSIPDQPSRRAAFDWYQKAFVGYNRAWARLREVQSNEKIVFAVRKEFDIVDPFRSLFARVLDSFERFGQAPQRTVDTALKIADHHAAQKEWKLANTWLNAVIEGYKTLLGENDMMVFRLLGLRFRIYTNSGDKLRALLIARQRVAMFNDLFGSVADSSLGAACAADLSSAYESNGDLEQALQWRLMAISGIRAEYDWDPFYIPPQLIRVARLQRKLHRHDEARTNCTQAIELCSQREPIDGISWNAEIGLAISLDALGSGVDAESVWMDVLSSMFVMVGPYHRMLDSYRSTFLTGMWNLCRHLVSEGRAIPSTFEGQALEDAVSEYGAFEGPSFRDSPQLVVTTDSQILLTSTHLS